LRALDRLIQRWRIVRATPFIPRGVRILDVGCADGALFRRLGSFLGEGLGVDPALLQPDTGHRYRLIPGTFPEDLPDDRPFDVITLLAVVEHIPRNQQAALAQACVQALRPGGRVIITTPSPAVDHVLRVLKALRLVDGMALEQHYGFNPSEVVPTFTTAGMTLVAGRRFQLGLNNLFVFRKGDLESDETGGETLLDVVGAAKTQQPAITKN
jgi:SAM-dependent methyltransferase